MKIDTRTMILTALFAALMTIGAYIQIPFPPVPITLQTAICVFAGCLLGPRAGAMSMALYVLVGLLGVPVFSAGGGLAYALKPSFGFLLGFIPGAYVAGMLMRQKKPGHLRSALTALAGVAAIHAIGIPYMYLMLRLNTGLNPGDAVTTVLSSEALFIAGELVKCALVGVVAPPVISRMRAGRQA